ncbi:hypothetical protein MFLO_00855 [Listeria floridensis FSL S10-1187]|uniref:CD-NTase-associated protein 12/Pycsar effector protein TIR domain-containing protein n=1 Tax=Listeria floridensis FSL S10-1187 TaxID=1265817 RepID=A0ABP3B1F2_9LIST|nr:TIR domain-containing protein [Listeria floridensis]EUJ33745.1 hypothetical protein MFLO_00855 [Listeria floridensis FSL S10-1187]
MREKIESLMEFNISCAEIILGKDTLVKERRNYIFQKVADLNEAKQKAGIEGNKFFISNGKNDGRMFEVRFKDFIRDVEHAKEKCQEELERYVFIIHGHSPDVEQLVRMMKMIKKIPILIKDIDNNNLSFIEKVEYYSGVNKAIALLTADDWGTEIKGSGLLSFEERARQNVIFEIGYFFGKIGREKVICISKQGLEKPSDMNGLSNLVYEKKVDEVFEKLSEMI